MTFQERYQNILEETSTKKLKVKRGWATTAMILLLIPIAVTFVLNKATGAVHWGTTRVHSIARASNEHLVDTRKEQKGLKDLINERLDELKNDDHKVIQSDNIKPQAEEMIQKGHIEEGSRIKVGPIQSPSATPDPV